MAPVSTLPLHLSRFGLLGACAGTHGQWRVVDLKSVSTDVLIRGFVAQVSSKLIYCNKTNEAMQVQAVFPVDESAAVYHCEARLDGRTIITHCMEKKKAEQVFKEAVAAGKTAVMARKHHDTSDILTLNLGNLPAETEAEVILRLVMELKVQTDGGISFVLPTVLNPRYHPADQPDTEAISSSPFSAGGRSFLDERIVHVPQPYSIKVKAEVRGSHQIARVISHTDALNVTLNDDSMSAEVQQDGGFNCDHDWSMLVYYNNAYQPHLLRETGDRAATGLMKDDMLMLNFFPEVPADNYSSRNEIIFVIDRSGSMQGDNILSARATLLLFLKSLPEGCLFNVVSFGNTFSLLFPEGSRIYTEETLNIACNLQANMQADMGGTEILQPLQYIYSKAPFPDYARQILLITDGGVWNVDQVLQLVGRHAHETRLFSVGVGHGASTALVRGAARAGRGRSEMVIQQGDLQRKVMGLVSSMVQENVQDVTIACEVEPTSRVTLVPKVPPVIFGGQHLVLYARLPHTTQVKSVTVRGRQGTKTSMHTLEGHHFTLVHDEAKSLHRLAARAQLKQWQLDEEEDVAEDMVVLSTASGVVCQRTALVGVDQESGKTIAEHTPPAPEQLGRNFMATGLMKGCARHPQTRPVCEYSDSATPPSFSFESSRASFGSATPAGFNSTQPTGDLQHTTAGHDKQLPSGLMGVVGLQQFDGSWKLKDVAQLTGVPLDALCATNPTKGESAWATALVLVLLEKKFNDQRDQWMLMATKAQTFIARKGEQVEELLAKARLTLTFK